MQVGTFGSLGIYIVSAIGLNATGMQNARLPTSQFEATLDPKTDSKQLH